MLAVVVVWVVFDVEVVVSAVVETVVSAILLGIVEVEVLV